MGLNRWLFVAFVGELCIAVAGFLVIRQVYRDVGDRTISPIRDLVTLGFLPMWLRGALLLAVGVALFWWGFRRILDVLLGPFPMREEPTSGTASQRLRIPSRS